MEYSGRTVLVTGGASGIGKAIAFAFAEEGANVVIHDRDIAAAEEVAAVLRAMGRQSFAHEVDVAKASVVRAAVRATSERMGPIHVLVNDAGVNIVKDVFDYSDADWKTIIGVNLTGTWNYCQTVGARMVADGGGAIVNIASVGATFASYHRVPYMASKGGVGMLTRALALDLAERGVRVNAVCPGSVDTGMVRSSERRFGGVTTTANRALTPMRRWARPSEVAEAVLFLGSERASFITGHLLTVDGGFSAGSQLGADWVAALPLENQ
jgi:NAD(P)-dependent dehydrogenase (short-subunit alcohol dehydrogenase family)